MNYRSDRIDKLIDQAKGILPSSKTEYDFSKLTNTELKDIVNDNLSESQLNELMESIKR